MSKPTALAKIEELQNQIEQLKSDAIAELKVKIADARKVVSDLEGELAELTGKPVTAEKRTRRPRSASISDDDLKPQILKVMAEYGKTGLNAVGIAEKIGQDANRVRKFLKDNPAVLKRQGNATATKFFLK